MALLVSASNLRELSIEGDHVVASRIPVSFRPPTGDSGAGITGIRRFRPANGVTGSESSFCQEGRLGALKRRPGAGRIVVLDPGSGRTEEPVSGCEPVALAIGVAPTCPPGSTMSPA